jgi:hypothetical protein
LGLQELPVALHRCCAAEGHHSHEHLSTSRGQGRDGHAHQFPCPAFSDGTYPTFPLASSYLLLLLACYRSHPPYAALAVRESAREGMVSICSWWESSGECSKLGNIQHGEAPSKATSPPTQRLSGVLCLIRITSPRDIDLRHGISDLTATTPVLCWFSNMHKLGSRRRTSLGSKPVFWSVFQFLVASPHRASVSPTFRVEMSAPFRSDPESKSRVPEAQKALGAITWAASYTSVISATKSQALT